MSNLTCQDHSRFACKVVLNEDEEVHVAMTGRTGGVNLRNASQKSQSVTGFGAKDVFSRRT